MGSLRPHPDPSPTSSLRRRLSLAGAGGPPAKLLSLPSAANTAADLAVDVELVSLGNAPLAYTSLKDIIPALPSLTPMSPAAAAGPATAATGHSRGDIPIRNRLVKQAAWAYLQPMAASSQSTAGSVFHRLCSRIAGDLRDHFAAGIHFFRLRVVPAISQAFGCLFGVLWLGGGDKAIPVAENNAL